MYRTLRVVGPLEALDVGGGAAGLLWWILGVSLVEPPKSQSGLPPYCAQNEVEAVKVRRTYRPEDKPNSGLVGTRNTVQRVGGNSPTPRTPGMETCLGGLLADRRAGPPPCTGEGVLVPRMD